MRPSERIKYLEKQVADLERYCEVLKGSLASANLPIPPRVVFPELNRQQRAVLGILFSGYPEYRTSWELLDCLPGHDHARDDRSEKLVHVLIHQCRKKLGDDAIINRRFEGYTLGQRIFHLMKMAEE